MGDTIYWLEPLEFRQGFFSFDQTLLIIVWKAVATISLIFILSANNDALFRFTYHLLIRR